MNSGAIPSTSGEGRQYHHRHFGDKSQRRQDHLPVPVLWQHHPQPDCELCLASVTPSRQSGQSASWILPNKCKWIDFQTLRLQELPDFTPQVEISRHMTLFFGRFLCQCVVLGNRVLICSIFLIKNIGKPSKMDGKERATVGMRSPYMRIVGMVMDSVKF